MNSSGFSLLELLFVVTICSILATLGLSSWRDLQDRNELATGTLGVLQFLTEVKFDANLYNYNQNIYFIKSVSEDWCIVATSNSEPDDCNGYLRFIFNYKNIELIGLKPNAMITFYGRRNMAKATTIRFKNRIGESRIIISVQGRIRYCSYRTYLAGFPLC